MVDIISIFDKNISYEKFFDHINNQHPQIKFTVEKSINNSLDFLDTEIKSSGDEFEFTNKYKCTFECRCNFYCKLVEGFSLG